MGKNKIELMDESEPREPSLEDHLVRLSEGIEALEYCLRDMLKIYWHTNHGNNGLLKQLEVMDNVMSTENLAQ